LRGDQWRKKMFIWWKEEEEEELLVLQVLGEAAIRFG
jgi:hypothetical protein